MKMTRHCGCMNYNNFSSRLSVPRLSVAAPSESPRKSTPKKERKSVRRRLVSATASMVLLAGWMMSACAPAGAIDLAPAELRLVPAPETVAFTGVSGRLTLDIPISSREEENDLAAQIEVLTAQVKALTSNSFSSVHPAHTAQLSALTGVLLCAGLGVVIVRAGLLFRTDLVC